MCLQCLTSARLIKIQIILMSFLVQFNGIGGQPAMNFANQGDKCTLFNGTALFKCPEIE
jgi:chitinase